MIVVNLILALLFQAPAPARKVVVGLQDGQQLVMENPQFSGFIAGPSGNAVLLYRQKNVHGEIPINTISRIDFGAYKRGKPLPMTVTLKNGQKLEVESERNDFISVRGKTDRGTVTINHPDPTSTPLKLSTKKPNRKKDLTIQYLEIPGS